MNQCELWTDNNDMIQEKDEINLNSKVHSFNEEKNFMLVAGHKPNMDRNRRNIFWMQRKETYIHTKW